MTLDAHAAMHNRRTPMKHPLLLTATALLALSACNQKAEENAANAANVAEAEAEANIVAEMPPAIKAQKTYRCKDASLVYIDFAEGDTQATLREGERTAAPVALTAEAAGQAYKAEGYSVSGSGSEVTIERPGKGSQACKA